mmetsp:Transcript_27178/g.48038  ORF Transcript_27178/g.48038 Transcript_27178/m.48038 type:complete len:93 (+) Transcript_27178:289-567(+)
MDGLSADDVEKLQDNDADKFDAAFTKTQDQMFSFVLRLKTEEYQEQQRTKLIVLRVETPKNLPTSAHKQLSEAKSILAENNPDQDQDPHAGN